MQGFDDRPRVERDGHHRLGHEHSIYWCPTDREVQYQKRLGNFLVCRAFTLHAIRLKNFDLYGSRLPEFYFNDDPALHHAALREYRQRVGGHHASSEGTFRHHMEQIAALENSVLKLNPTSDFARLLRHWELGQGSFTTPVSHLHLLELFHQIAPRAGEHVTSLGEARVESMKKRKSISKGKGQAGVTSTDKSPKLVGDVTLRAYRQGVNFMHRTFGDSDLVRSLAPGDDDSVKKAVAAVKAVLAPSSLPFLSTQPQLPVQIHGYSTRKPKTPTLNPALNSLT